MNRYYRVVGDRGFQVYRHFGHSASNSYVGASRVINTVMEAVNVKAGDEIHVLVGGTFLVEKDGLVSEIALKPPKPVFEKTYGGDSAADIMAARAKHGLATEVVAPPRAPDYGAARRRTDANKLPDLHPEIIRRVDSPEWSEMAAAVGSAVESMGADPVPSVKGRDIDAYGGPYFEIALGDVRIGFKAGARGVYVVEVPADLDVAGPKDPVVVNGRKVHYFRTVDGIADPLGAARAFLTSAVSAMAPAAPGIGPR